MNWNMVINIAAGAVLIISWFLISYFKTSSVFRGFIAQLISDAEWVFSDVEKAGKQKMDWVIEKLYGYIPAVLRPLFPSGKLEEIVQMVFDRVKDFADLQVEKLKAAYEKEKAEREETFRSALEKAEPAADAGTRTSVARKASKKAVK
jgi:hypothetical protein